ncbi:MAG TPA: aldose 1-epimerase family protein [Thermomicrobiales bacterium]|nr:aldose 1-epimerase family protein [Thermomicrobiales bacterium]
MTHAPLNRNAIARFTGDALAPGGVRAVVLDNGQERGIRLLEFSTSQGLRFDIVVDRAMDIGRVEFQGTAFSWNSPTGYRHPAYFSDTDENGISLMRGMSGLLVTGGLDHIFSATQVSGERYGYPARRTVHHPLHGRISNTPAELHGYGCDWREDGAVLWAEGTIRQVAVFGEHLELVRRIEADIDGADIRVFDRVRNAGFDVTPHRLLYHVNLGWPFLNEGVRFEAETGPVRWQSANVRDEMPFSPFPPPIDGFVEQCFDVSIVPTTAEETCIRVVNDSLGRWFELAYDHRSLPAFVQWINARSGSYSVALEPCTHGILEMKTPEATPYELIPGEERFYRATCRFGATSR